jgi:hypothetical protein
MNRYAILKNKSVPQPPQLAKPADKGEEWKDVDVSTSNGLSVLLNGVYKGFVSAEDAAKIIRKEQRRAADAAEIRLSRATEMGREKFRRLSILIMGRYDILKNKPAPRKKSAIGTKYRLKNGIIVKEMWRDREAEPKFGDVVGMLVASVPLDYKNRMFDDVATWHVGQMKIFRGNSSGCGSAYDIVED